MDFDSKQYTARILDETVEDIADLDNFYYEVTGEEKYAERFEAAFYEAVEALTYMPRIFPMWQSRDDVRRYNMMTHNVAIIYLIDDDELEIVAVKAFHTMQEPEKIIRLVDMRLEKYRNR